MAKKIKIKIKNGLPFKSDRIHKRSPFFMFFSWYVQQIPPAVHAEPVDCTRSSSGRNNTELPRASRCSGGPF